MPALRPELRAETAREILRRYLRPGQTTMQDKAILRRLEQDQRIGTVIEARVYLKALKDAGEIECTWVDRLGPVGQVTLKLRPPSISPVETEWRREAQIFVAQREDARLGDEAALNALWPKLGDWPLEQANLLFTELFDLRSRLEAGSGQTLTCYQASASGRLASSKLLSILPRAALQGFGIDPCLFPEPPPYVIVAGPANPEAVVLVENPEAFEAAVQATPALPVAWVSTYGFGISHVDGTGTRMVSAITSPVAPIPLIRSGSPPRLDRLLKHPRLFHWGDLDRTGLLIFRAMESARPQLRLSALYAPMIALLCSGGGHPYADATGKPNQDRWVSDDVMLTKLTKLCDDRAVDQEHLDQESIRELALQALDEVWPTYVPDAYSLASRVPRSLIF